jgi:hypothetical protein
MHSLTVLVVSRYNGKNTWFLVFEDYLAKPLVFTQTKYVD